ncbi:hypothetical protein [Burkholderia sp. PAMC 26561]|uniref:hypothetical protein n=1 Tax=Burkholderia sp. PAMC 26561 TaxID=1795043 RepID=UPI00076B54D3|nr:hypothetical protein [Burkholderia sp. PAMC 26561]AMH42798.1 hypothetical protein AXG89_41460 [Burkholderia sp. PAMC 26561]
MAIIPNLRRHVGAPAAATGRTTAPSSFGYIDNLFDYGAYLEGLPNALGTAPTASPQTTIAIIGGGIAGLVAAYELLRAGI